MTCNLYYYLEVRGLVGVLGALVVDEYIVGGVRHDPGAVDAGTGGDLPRGLDPVVPLRMEGTVHSSPCTHT